MGELTTAVAAASRPLNILIVDDSAMMRAMIKRVIAVCGVSVDRVLEAGNGREAIDVLANTDVDVLFTDINMPVMGGTELLRAIHDDGRWSALRRAIISTDGSAVRRAEAAQLGVRVYLEKPFSPEKMRDVLRELTTAA